MPPRRPGGWPCATAPPGPAGSQGFPVVEVQSAGATLITARPTLNGAVGGVRTASVPPIIVLPPGATAAAIIEQSPPSAPGSCPQSDRLVVTLPNGVRLDPLPVQLPACGLIVHPLVGNVRGTDQEMTSVARTRDDVRGTDQG